jgi:hypothetical protein
MKGEKQKILEGKAALYQLSPEKSIKFFIGFPFDPTVNLSNGESATSYEKERFFATIIDMSRFFAHDETLVANELWNFLSDDTDTMQQILDIINVIATTDFQDKYDFLNEPQNRKNEWTRYLQQLNEWNLFSEIA